MKKKELEPIKDKYIYQRHKGKITKYIIRDDYNSYIEAKTGFVVQQKDEVILLGKTSENILDLIEMGDIIEYIDDLEGTNEYIKSFIVTKTELQLKAFKEYLKSYCKVISILTHKQFEKNSYKVEG